MSKEYIKVTDVIEYADLHFNMINLSIPTKIPTRMIVFVFESLNCLFHHKLRHLAVVDIDCVVIFLSRGCSPLVYQVKLLVSV